MHPLASIINHAEGFVLIGNSSEDRFPAMSYHAYTTAQKKFYCLDMGALASSRGKTKPGACKGHTLMVKATGTYRRPPQTEAGRGRRGLL